MKLIFIIRKVLRLVKLFLDRKGPKMKAFNEVSIRRLLSPWGAEVKSMLLIRDYNIDKQAMSNLLYGLGASNRQPEIEYIIQVLDIPYAKRLQSGA